MSIITKKLSIALVFMITIVSILFFAEITYANNSYQGTVDTYILNVRENPNTNSKVVGQLKRNEKIVIINTIGNWGEIKYNSKQSYVSIDFIKPVDGISTDSSNEIWVQSKVTSLNMREKPSTNSKTLGSLGKGIAVKVVGKSGDWAQIVKGNVKAFVHLSYLEETKKPTIDNTTNNTKTPTNNASSLKGKVNANALNVREDFNTKSKIIGGLNRNQIIDYQDMKNGWGQVSLNGRIGYVSLNYISDNQGGIETAPETIKAKSGIITATALNIRSEPNTTSNVIGVLKNGEKILIEKIENKWITFTYQNKKSFISSDYVKIDSDTQLENNIEKEEAKSSLVAYVTATSLNVRAENNTSSIVLGNLSKGETVKIESVGNNWAKISYKSGFGYVSASYIKYDENKSTESNENKENIYIVKADALNVRDNSSINGKLIGKLKKGEQLNFLNKKGEWLEIKLNNRNGFVHSNYIEMTTKDALGLSNNGLGNGNGLTGRKIVLDAGHGGTDSGASANSMKEKDIVLDVILKAKKTLEAQGAVVVLTRSNDTFVRLDDRVSISNKSGADAFISVHANSSYYKTANGVETYYYTGNQESLNKLLAETLHQKLLKTSTMTDRKIKQASFQVIKYNQKPSVLLELGFISNSFDSSFLKSDAYRNKVAGAITEGLIEYFNKK